MRTLLKNHGSTNSVYENFLDTLILISRHFYKSGVEVPPFANQNLIYFKKLNFIQQNKVLQHARMYLDVCETAARTEGISDSRCFVWNGIKKLGLRPTSDLFEKMDNDDVVEIHDFEGHQLFRNLNYFKYSSYDLEALLCREYSELFSYEKSTYEQLGNWFGQVASGDWKEVRPFNIPSTQICELLSPLKYNLEVEFRMGGPLFAANGQPAATVSLERAMVKGSIASSAGAF